MIPDEAVNAAQKAYIALRMAKDYNTPREFAEAMLEAALPYLNEAARHQRKSPTEWPDIPKVKS